MSEEKNYERPSMAKRLAAYALVLTVGYGIGHYKGMNDQYALNTEECKTFMEEKVNDLKHDIQKEMEKRMGELSKDKKSGIMEGIEQKVGLLYHALFP